MLKYQDIDGTLRALAEPTRRAIVDRLSRGPASVSDLAKPFDITLAAVVQHLQVLEESGLIRTEKSARAHLPDGPRRVEPTRRLGLRAPRRDGAPSRPSWRNSGGNIADRSTHPSQRKDTMSKAAVIDELRYHSQHIHDREEVSISPARVFFGMTDKEMKRRWLIEGDGFEIHEYESDFRIGGFDRSRFTFGGGLELTNDTQFQDVVPDRRLVFTYRTTIGGKPLSVSLVTVEFVPDGKGTSLTYTEQGVYFGGAEDVAGREHGTRELLEKLGAELGR